jgi:hypothetical protein
MPSFTPVNPITSGIFSGVESVKFIGTYGEIGISYGEQTVLFNGAVGVWRYAGFYPAFVPKTPVITGVFIPA